MRKYVVCVSLSAMMTKKCAKKKATGRKVGELELLLPKFSQVFAIGQLGNIQLLFVSFMIICSTYLRMNFCQYSLSLESAPSTLRSDDVFVRARSERDRDFFQLGELSWLILFSIQHPCGMRWGLSVVNLAKFYQFFT